MNLQIRNGSVTLGGEVILEEVNFDIKNREHVAIVGRNGAGKSTLLKAIVDNTLFDEGIGIDKFSINVLGKLNIGYLKQIDFENENLTLMEEINKSFAELINMEKKMAFLVEEMNKKNSDALIKEYTTLEERYRMLDGYSYKKEYEIMLNKFGFKEEDKHRQIKTFSGGQKTKIAFIKLLLSKPDLLLLDEPTNHLDIVTIEWLENYLKNYPKALIIVSHDRMFLDRIVDIVYEIDYGRTVKYNGNYSYYEKEKKLSYERMLKDYEFQQKEIKRLNAIYERFRFKPSKASMALSKLKQIERMDLIEKPNKIDTRTFKTNLSEIEPSVKQVLHVKDLVIGYDKPLAKVTFDCIRGKKIAVIGANGIGKSTLLKTINGSITPLGGSLEYGLRVKPGYFDQTLATIDNDFTVIDDFRSFLPNLTLEQSRSALGSFLFKGDDVYKQIKVLSGGEKVRLQLCKILYNKPNFLILDEPTNHMDIIGKSHLEDILTEYTGTILFVSHDRYFINKIADQLLVFSDDEVKFYPFGYKEYEETIRNVIVPEKKIPEKKSIESPKVKKVNNNHEIKKEINRIEKEIIKLEVKLNKLNTSLFEEENYNDPIKAKRIASDIEEGTSILDSLNKEWESLIDSLE